MMTPPCIWERHRMLLCGTLQQPFRYVVSMFKYSAVRNCRGSTLIKFGLKWRGPRLFSWCISFFSSKSQVHAYQIHPENRQGHAYFCPRQLPTTEYTKIQFRHSDGNISGIFAQLLYWITFLIQNRSGTTQISRVYWYATMSNNEQ